MVQLTSTKNGVLVESILPMSEGQKQAIKKNAKKFANACKDLHVSHNFFSQEDGTLMSKIARHFDNFTSLNIKEVDKAHKKLLKLVNTWIDCNDAEKDVAEVRKAIEKVGETAKKYNCLMGVVLMNDDGEVTYFGSIPPSLIPKITKDWK